MPKANVKQDGPQEVGEYVYPAYEFLVNNSEVIRRRARVSATATAAGANHEVTQNDGLRGFPIEGQPEVLEVALHGQIPVGFLLRLHFCRPIGTTGPYELYAAPDDIDDDNVPMRPATRVRRQT